MSTERDPAAVTRGLVVCVDDFGLDGAIDEAVFSLAAQGRIDATSCLVDGPSFAANAPQLARHRSAGLQVGLHLNLTEALSGAPLHSPLASLIAAAYAGRLDPATLQREVERQWMRFEENLGFAPDHVDGHQHVHQLPTVRDALWQCLAMRSARPWLRSCMPGLSRHAAAEGVGGAAKALAIGALGARAFARGCAARGRTTSTRLLGVYGFAPGGYGPRVYHWLGTARRGDVLMCHPAMRAAPGDPIGEARAGEYEVLAGSEFGDALARTRARLGAAA